MTYVVSRHVLAVLLEFERRSSPASKQLARPTGRRHPRQPELVHADGPKDLWILAWQGDCSGSTNLWMRAGGEAPTLADQHSRQHRLTYLDFRKQLANHQINLLTVLNAQNPTRRTDITSTTPKRRKNHSIDTTITYGRCTKTQRNNQKQTLNNLFPQLRTA